MTPARGDPAACGSCGTAKAIGWPLDHNQRNRNHSREIAVSDPVLRAGA